MRSQLTKTALVVLPLAGLLVSACSAHERFHYDLDALHEEFHEHPYTSAEHRRFHEDLQALHEDEHARGSYGDRYDERDPYSGGGRYYDRGY